MSREIKFRAWLKEDKKMVNVETLFIGINRLCFGNSKTEDLFFRDFEEVELMQYTGLKDKNSKEIYEKDIVSCNKYKNIVVFFENGCFKVRYPKNDTTNIICALDTFLEKYKCKISGNIYENFELLEENK
jgi:hypothetical protein